jgi:hypothetical protein
LKQDDFIEVFLHAVKKIDRIICHYTPLYRVAIKTPFMVAAGFSLRLHRRDAYATN